MKKILVKVLFLLLTLGTMQTFSQNERVRDYGIRIGVLKPGKNNAITDVEGVKVGHTTLIAGDSIRTGVTAILPHSGNIFQWKVPAAIYLGNGFGKLAGYSQVKELGNIETPIVLTNTLSVPVASNALISYTLNQDENKEVRSVNPVVGETNDGWLNDIRGRHIKEADVLQAIENAKGGPVEEGNVGAGTGTRCFQYKGGIGTASRVLPAASGGYTVGVLVQTNFGGVFELSGIPIAKELDNYSRRFTYDVDGSCMMVVMTDAPLESRNLERLAKRAMMGLAKTGGIASNGSGDYVIAVSTAKENRIPYTRDTGIIDTKLLRNEGMTPLFLATIEATEEAILNSLFAANDMVGRNQHHAKALPIHKVIEIMGKYNRIEKN
ncbi:P1 family peptidase [Flavobacteriaceae bacterium TP-CH-4]|uniref:P1 family peptidase n=1 Tax=Pelagihabitans pacificus TaxID=2696054 RepID=A0A967E3Z2_9FLAO|nr:P1 family peptidase [Pelagihabitans pacificus]NHF57857.1 P1 family peptidase [Pelagihabitans pacificus]